MLRDICKKCHWYLHAINEVCTNSNWMPYGYFDKFDPEDKKCTHFTKIEKFIKYKPHNEEVWVRGDLKGKYIDYCLCFKCKKLIPEDRDKNCPMANKLDSICIVNDLVIALFECPIFEEK